MKLFKPLDGCKEFEGKLLRFDENAVVIGMGDKEQTFLRNDIAIIRLALDF